MLDSAPRDLLRVPISVGLLGRVQVAAWVSHVTETVMYSNWMLNLTSMEHMQFLPTLCPHSHTLTYTQTHCAGLDWECLKIVLLQFRVHKFGSVFIFSKCKCKVSWNSPGHLTMLDKQIPFRHYRAHTRTYIHTHVWINIPTCTHMYVICLAFGLFVVQCEHIYQTYLVLELQSF